MSVVYAEDSEMEKVKKSENLEVYQPQNKSKPRVYYKNLHRYTRCFVAGSVALQDIDECAEGAKITLMKGAKKVVDKTVTNNYGDFRIDNLEEKSGKYVLEVAYKGYAKKTVEVDVKTSVNLGTIFL